MSGVLDWVRAQFVPEPVAPPAPPALADRRLLCIGWVLMREGGYVNNPNDAGAATNWGITQATLAAWRGVPVTPADVQAMPQSEAISIYTAQYFNQMQCGALPAGVDLSVLDAGVMSGPRQGVRFLQSAVGVSADGVVGRVTLDAVEAADAKTLIAGIANERDQYYEGLARTNPNDQEFLRGWENRVALTETQGVGMAG